MAQKPHIRWLILAALALGVTAALLMLLAPRPLKVETAEVRRGPIAETVQDQGEARVRRAYVVSSPINGETERLPVEVGDPVQAGVTVVAQLRPAASSFLDPRARAQAQAAVASARSALASAEAQRERLNAEAIRAKGELDRDAALASKGFLSRQRFDNAKSAAAASAQAVRGADADIHARRADLAAARSALLGPDARSAGLVSVTSPASGHVTRLLQQSQRTVTSGTPLVEVSQTSGLEAQIEFLSQDAAKIRPGMAAEVYDWGGPKPIPAEVRLVEPQGYLKISALGVEEQRALVMLQFTGPPSDWKGLGPGYRVWGRVYLRRVPDALLAPIGALVRDRGGWAVFRVEQGRARLRPIEVGALTDRDAEVRAGLKPGDRLVAYPSDKVRDGLRVEPPP